MCKLFLFFVMLLCLGGCAARKQATGSQPPGTTNVNATVNNPVVAASKILDEPGAPYVMPEEDPLFFRGNYVIEEPDPFTLIVYPETGEWNNFFAGVLSKDSTCGLSAEPLNSSGSTVNSSTLIKSIAGGNGKDSTIWLVAWTQPVISRTFKAKIKFTHTPEMIYFGDLNNPKKKYSFKFYYKQ